MAAPVTPPIDAPGAVILDLLDEGSPERSRSPISASAILSSTPKPPGPRPRAGGIRTPVPPTPRPKYLGVRTPSPPRVDPGSRYVVTRPKRRPRPIEDGSSDYYHSEFPSIEESFVPKASGVPISSGYIGDWTSEQWREYNQRQEAASSSADRAVPAPTGSTFAAAACSSVFLMHPPRSREIWSKHWSIEVESGTSSALIITVCLIGVISPLVSCCATWMVGRRSSCYYAPNAALMSLLKTRLRR